MDKLKHFSLMALVIGLTCGGASAQDAGYSPVMAEPTVTDKPIAPASDGGKGIIIKHEKAEKPAANKAKGAKKAKKNKKTQAVTAKGKAKAKGKEAPKTSAVKPKG